MAGVGLLAAFPLAYGILLPAFYIPLIAMLLGLGLRGVSFEFRYQVDRRRRVWDLAFGAGSVIGALMQGFKVGGLVQGIAVTDDHFSGSVLDVFRAFPALTALAVLTGYVVLGAGWLHLKATSKLLEFASLCLWVGTPTFVGVSAAACVASAFAQPRVQGAWTSHPAPLGLIAAIFPTVAVLLVRSTGSRQFAFNTSTASKGFAHSKAFTITIRCATNDGESGAIAHDARRRVTAAAKIRDQAGIAASEAGG